MVLSKNQLLECLREGKIAFTPALDSFQIQPNSIDLRIGWSFYAPEAGQYTDAGRVAVQPDYLQKGSNRDYLKLIKLKPGQYFEILPRELILISSLEKIELRTGELMAILHPRSSMVRRGFIIQGGVVDTHYSGHLIIPVLNSTNHYLKLWPGERAYQLVFHPLSSALSREEAMTHGLGAAKYSEATAYNLEARTDSDEEIALIKKGDIDGLKEKFAANAANENAPQ